MNDKERGLTRTEATLAVNWLRNQGVEVQSGWIGLFKRTPSAIADEYEVELADLLDVIHR